MIPEVSVEPPVPETVPGTQAGLPGLPHRSQLSWGHRLIVDCSAVADVGLRTALASAMGAAMIPPLLKSVGQSSERRRQGEGLSFYAARAAEHSPETSFPRLSSTPTISSRPAGMVAKWVANGRVDNIRFASTFTAVNPTMRNQWAALTSNNVVHAQHWRHHDGPRPTLCVIHGFMGSAYLFNGLFFALPWFYRSGYDVLLYTLPFHGRRAERFSPFSGYGLFAHGQAGLAEAMAQSVHDFRSLIDYLRGSGVQRISLTGMSLGGYAAALIAAVEDRIDVVIPNVPVVTPDSAFNGWFPANRLVRVGNRLSRIDPAGMSAASEFHSPLNYPPLVPPPRRLIITGLGDRLAPPSQSELLWEHWDRCAMHWFPGSHFLHVNQQDYLRKMAQFMHPFMFDVEQCAAPSWPAMRTAVTACASTVLESALRESADHLPRVPANRQIAAGAPE